MRSISTVLFSSLVATLLAPAPIRAQEPVAPLDAPLVTLDLYDRYGIVVDLDDDGFMDAVSWWWTDGFYRNLRIRGWHNDGRGNLEEVWTTYASLSSGSEVRMFRCDLDSDGMEDFYLVSNSPSGSTADRVQAWHSRGLLAPMQDLAYYQFANVAEFHARIADFSGDGLADLATCADGVLRLFECTPEGTMELRSESEPFGSPTTPIGGLLVIDANGDSTPDLVVWDGATLKMIEIEDCAPSATQTHTQGILAQHMPAVGDIDRDGDQDLVIWDMSQYVVARRTGAASWSIEPPVVGGPAEFLIDVDGDGDLDGVCCGGGDPLTPANNTPSLLRVSVNDGTGAFAPALETNWLGSDHLAGIADLDHDGDMDVVSGRCILYARGSLTEVLHPRLGTLQSDRSIADVDGDSDPDYHVGLRTMERNLGQGLATSHEPSFPSAPAGTSFVGPGWPGDFDGDGDLDLVVKHFAGTTLLGQRLLTNLGGGAFADAGPAEPSGLDFNPGVTGGNESEASLAADVDGDGDVDLITLPTNSNTSDPSRIWLNDGAGQFVEGVQIPKIRAHQVADLNGDGIPDLVSIGSSLYSGQLFWHRGLGGGTFGPRQAIGFEYLSWDPHRCAVADLDADGDLDMAATGDENTFRIRWNDGAGHFTEDYVESVRFTSSFSAQQRRVLSADLDADGLLDLLVAPVSGAKNGVAILMREPDNSDWRAPLYQVLFDPSGINAYLRDGALCDVDGDGDVDLVSDRLVRNTTFSPPHNGRRRQGGTGLAGTGGLVPTLGADGPFRFGESAQLRVRGGLGGATGHLTITLVRGGQRGPSGNGWIAPTFERVLARIPITLGGVPGTAGTGSWTLPYTVSTAFVSQTRRYVVELDDPGAPGGVACSNELLLTYGF